jgi:hypothetical protein
MFSLNFSLTLCVDEAVEMGIEEAQIPHWMRMMIGFRRAAASGSSK